LPKKNEKVPVATLVDSFFDLTGLTGRPDVDAAQLKNIIVALPESEGKQVMLKWIDQGVADIYTLRTRVNSYFTGLLDQSAAGFNPMHAVTSSAFRLFLHCCSGRTASNWQRIFGTMPNCALLRPGRHRSSLKKAVGRWIQKPSSTLWINSRLSDLAGGRWKTSSLQVPVHWNGWGLYNLLGICITAVAVSQGSCFWYDLLKKVTAPPVKPETSLDIESEAAS